MEIKIGSLWLHSNKHEYTVIKNEPHDVIAMTNPFVDPEKEGFMWAGGAEQFLKEFKPK